VEAVTLRLAEIPGLAAFNRRQIEICAIHSGGKPYEIIHDVPCLIAEDARHHVPLTLITEFPDETIYGDAFRFAHTVQMMTVLAAEEAHAEMMSAVV
jgi:beta-glucosidase-like glycosyl hydrolase